MAEIMSAEVPPETAKESDVGPHETVSLFLFPSYAYTQQPVPIPSSDEDTDTELPLPSPTANTTSPNVPQPVELLLDDARPASDEATANVKSSPPKGAGVSTVDNDLSIANESTSSFMSALEEVESAEGTWRLTVKGWICVEKPGSFRKRIVVGIGRLLASPAPPPTTSDPEKRSTSPARGDYLDERAGRFFSRGLQTSAVKIAVCGLAPRVRNEETRKMEMATLDKIVEGKPVFWVTTQTSGLFAVTLDVKKEMVRKWREEADPTLYDHSQLQILAFKSSGNHAGTCVYSTVDLIEETGISLISDLDDTIKESDVHMGKRAAIKSAFFGDGIAVPGMSDAYQYFRSKDVAMHYVSASPYQLFPTLLNFMIAHHFPLGSMHLRDIWAPGNMSTRSYKVACITQIFEHFPSRKFIFVGDSGEKDSEISATLHALFPDRILKIFIRDVTFLGPGGERRQAADSRHSTQIAHVRNVLAGLPEEKWSLFESSEALLLDEMVRRIILDSVEAKRNVVESGKGVVDEVHVLA